MELSLQPVGVVLLASKDLLEQVAGTVVPLVPAERDAAVETLDGLGLHAEIEPVLLSGWAEIPPGVWYAGIHCSRDGHTWQLALYDPVRVRELLIDSNWISVAPPTMRIALELATRGVRVNAISPGLLDTQIWTDIMAAAPTRKECMDHWRAQIPIGRVIAPDGQPSLVHANGWAHHPRRRPVGPMDGYYQDRILGAGGARSRPVYSTTRKAFR